MLHYLPYVLVITLWIYAFVDCLGTPEPLVRGLPKVVWVLVVLVLGPILLGPLAWLAMGRRRGPGFGGGPPAQWHRGHRPGSWPEIGPDGRHAATGQPLEAPDADWVPPDDNPAFLRSLDELNRNRRKDGTPPSEGE